jgi:CHAD domain-containing protein
MAYRLRPRESVTQGLRRLATKELRSARGELRKTNPPCDEAIHEARKSIKKVRAILELIEADRGRGLAGSRKRLRSVNRTLSRLRDADAMVEILTKLTNKHPRMFDEHTFARVQRRLFSHKQASAKAARDHGAWKSVDRNLRRLRRHAKRWQPIHRRFGTLAAGIEVSYRRGRKAMARAQKRQRATDFHEWRKQIKALWYQLRLVEACSPDIRRDVRVLHQAATWLGDDHNVVVLCAELAKDTSLCDLDRLRGAADRYQCDLRQRTSARTAGIYADTPAAYLGRVERAWDAWRRKERTDRKRGPRRVAA